MEKKEKNSLFKVAKSYGKETAVAVAVLTAVSTNSANAQILQNDHQQRKEKIAVWKKDANKKSALKLFQQGHFEEAYKIAFDSEAQGVIKSEKPIDYIEDAKEETNGAYLEAEKFSKYIKENPWAEYYFGLFDKKNEVNESLLNGEYKDISELTNKVFTITDTVKLDPHNRTSAAQYILGGRFIRKNFFKLDETQKNSSENKEKLEKALEIMNSQEYVAVIIAHELGHKKNDEGGIHDKEFTYANGVEVFDISLPDHNRLMQADEISSDMQSMIFLHEEYKKTDTISKAMRISYPEYADAIIKGKIDPNSTDPKDEQKEMALIAEIAIKEWNNENKQIYNAQLDMLSQDYSDLVLNKRTEESKNGATINPQSVPLTLNKKLQNCFTFVFNGKKQDFFKYVDMNKIQPHGKVLEIEKDFYKKITDENKKCNPNYKNPLTYDATNLFVKKQEQRQ